MRESERIAHAVVRDLPLRVAGRIARGGAVREAEVRQRRGDHALVAGAVEQAVLDLRACAEKLQPNFRTTRCARGRTYYRGREWIHVVRDPRKRCASRAQCLVGCFRDSDTDM